METQIKAFRVEIDRAINSVNILNPSREVSLAHTSLQRSKMFLGKVLAELGTKNPYPESSNPESKKIEPEADKAEDNLMSRWSKLEETQTAYVKDMRSYLQDKVDYFREFLEVNGDEITDTENVPWIMFYLLESCMALEEAKMWFGWELGQIRERLNGINECERKYLPLQ